MCTVSVTVDDKMLQHISPDLTTKESIGRWLQQKVDIMIGDMIEESSYNDVSVEELYLAIEKDVKEIYIADACHAQNMHE